MSATLTPERWRQIEQLYLEARRCAPPERAALLSDVCAWDDGLRLEVESLLAHEASAAAFFSSRALDAAGASDRTETAFEPRTTVGSYRIEGLLGRGGMGAVFLAYDTTLHRRIALKVVDAPEGAETSRAQLLREARSAAALNHPNICTIHEVGYADGRAFIAMEHVEGRSLYERLGEGPSSLDETLTYGIQACEALDYAHEQGVVHRDFKAANVIVNKAGRVKIVDFGLARRDDALVATATTVRSIVPDVGVAGTPYAMAPEQVRGGPTDARTDIWALGVLLYEMVSGTKPFKAASINDLFSSILRDAPEPLPESVPGALRAIIARCLAKDPADRFPRAGEVGVSLRAIHAGAHVRLGLRRLVAAAAAVVGVGIGLLALNAGGVRDRLMGGDEPSTAAIRVAVLPFENPTRNPDEEYFSEGLTNALITDLAGIQALHVIAPSTTRRYKGAEKPLKAIAADLNVDAIVAGSAQRVGNDVHLAVQLTDAQNDTSIWSDRYERSTTDVLRLSREIAGAITREVNVMLTPDQRIRLTSGRQVKPAVYEAYLRGMFYLSQETPEGIEKGLQHLHRAVEIDPADPLAYAGLAEGYVTIGHSPTPPPETFPRARAAAERALTLDPTLAEAVQALADVALYYEWDWPKAERLFLRALELNQSLAMTHYHYAWYLALVDRLDEAIEEHKIARDLDPLRPLHTAWLGGLYHLAGRHDEAIAEARKALELSPDFGPSYYVMFLAHTAQGMPEDALAAAQAATESRSRYAGPILTATALANLGRRAEARSMFARADAPNAYLAIAYLAAIGDSDQAFREIEAAFEARMPVLPWIRLGRLGYNPLHADPRFTDLLRRLKLPK